MKVFETENSLYYVDEQEMRYMRKPLADHNVASHRLTYDEWHPMKSWEVTNGDRLWILREDSKLGIITSPIYSCREE